MQPLYRFASLEHNKTLASQGSIRIGTLKNFRSSEHQIGILDEQEGLKRLSHVIEDMHIHDMDSPEAKENTDLKALGFFNIFKFAPGTKNARIQGITVSREVESQNYYILCMSERSDKATMQRFGKYDSCISIPDPHSFIQAATELLNTVTPVEYCGLHKVAYASKDEPWNGKDSGMDPALFKAERFALDFEWRALWAPLDEKHISPKIFSHSDLNRYVGRIETFD